jgi:hypothetical protein
MRSQIVFGALLQVSNRYQLCQLATKATRKLHKPNTRLEVTISDVLNRFQGASPEANTAKEAHAALLMQRRRPRGSVAHTEVAPR